MRLYQAFYPDQWLDLCIQTIAHQLKFAVGWNEADGAIILKSRQAHTLMELDVFHLHSFPPSRSACRFEHDLVVQAKTQFRHTGQVTLHLNRTKNFGPEHVPTGADEKVERLNDVQEDFVLSIADTFASP